MAIFGKKITKAENPYRELQEGMEDQDVIHIIQQWGQKDDSFEKKLLIEGKRNKSYFVGKYDRDIQTIAIGRSNVVDNRIFSAIKSVVPFITSKPAQPVCYAKKDSEDKAKTEESKFISNCTQDILKKLYDDSQVQKLNEQNSINRYLYKIGLLRYGLRDGKLFTRVVNPQKCIFDCSAKQFKDSLYFGEPIDYTASELVEMYPDKKDDIMKNISGKGNTRIQCYEWWTEKVVCVTIGTQTVLNIKKNPFLNDEKNLNYYGNAPIPYVALNVYNLGDEILDSVSEIDLTYLLQDAVNDITRATIDNVKFCGNPVKVATGMNQEQVSLIGETEPGDSLSLGKDQDIKYLQATGMPAFVDNTLQTLKNEIDAIFGTQATFRGEFEGVQSGVSRDILRQQAANSLAQLSRGIERMMDDLYRGWLHLIMVYSNDAQFVDDQIRPILGDRTDKYIEYLFNDNDGIEVSVLPGTILPDDPVTRAEQAMELAKMNRITNTLLYESLKIPNADEEADKLDLNQTVIAIKAQELQQRATQQEQEGAMMANEADKINQEIDALGAEGSAEQAPGTPPTPNAPMEPNAPVNINIGNPAP